jgi:hypothetical protein
MRFKHTFCAVLASIASTAAAEAQSLASRVSNAPEGRVHFSFAARDGVCGNGRSFISVGDSHFIGSYVNSETARESCEPGPVRVILDRADGAVIGVETFAGGASRPVTAGVIDLGMVRARDAAEYLLSLAARLDGRPGRDAILPAALADSAEVSPGLLAIGRDRDRPRETRRSALSWLVRVSDQPAEAKRAADALVAIARDGEDHAAVRQQALSTLARLDHGSGVPALVTLSRNAGDDVWLAREAMEALARSGDPRARDHLRSVVEKAEVAEPLLTSAIRGLAREYATAKDAALLRNVYARLQTERSRQAVVQSIGEMGGSENARWLLTIAQRTDEKEAVRRQALQMAARAGVSAAELSRMYDRADARLKELLLGHYAQSGERAAVDRLLSVAKTEEDRQLRRRAIQYLSRIDDPRAKALLQELVVER